MAATDSSTAPVDLVRTDSQTSASPERKSSTVRAKASKRSSTTSLKRAPSPAADTKSLTSFPSLSPTPDSSPVQSRVNGWFRSAIGVGENGDKNGENKLAKSPETVRTIVPTEISRNGTPSSTVRKVTRNTQDIVGSLVATSSSVRDRSALFDDTPQEPDKVPGNLHYSSDRNIKDVLERTGPVALVKQLAGDLAQRDAQITALRRRAEERERILRKMLQECEVSNMDIENRLRKLDRTREQQNGNVKRSKRSEVDLPGLHPEDPMDQRLALAMEDEVTEFPDALGLDTSNALPEEDAASFESGAELQRETSRSNWRSYLWNGPSRKSSRAPSVASLVDQNPDSQTRSRASSGAKQTRRPITDDLFKAPSAPAAAGKGTSAVPTLKRLQSQDREHSTTSSRRSSTSITNWALKMVAGNNQAKTDRAGTARGRKHNSSDPAERTASIDSTKTSQSSQTVRSNPKMRGGRTSLGPNGTIKSINTDTRTQAANPSPHMPPRGASNLGPVEMDRILPEESRPPTLLQHHNNFQSNNEYLTDRFGFIYDQRRKKRQSEAAAALAKQKRSSNVESLGDTRSALTALGYQEEGDETKPPPSDINEDSRSPSRPGSVSSGEQATGQSPKTWADYLKLATFPTELLSHTPSAVPITVVEAPEADIAAPKLSQVTVTKQRSMPTTSVNPEPSPSRIVSGNAEFATASPSLMTPASPIAAFPPQSDPVKALLEQLTELHDSLQRDKTVKWNEFLRKVRAERKREGEAGNSAEGRPKGLTMPEAHLGDGELVGITGLGNKGKVGRAKWQEFRRLVLGGIPVAYRAKIWAESSGASTLRVPGYYDDLVSKGGDNQAIVAQIQMDITRTLTDNIYFRKGQGVQKLNEVLVAYSRRNPEVGYCQGMNLITAYLLLILPTAEDAFWVLATMIEQILPQKYYDQQLLTSRADQSVLRSYVAELLPKLSQHLEALEIELEALTFQWFLSVFTDCLSAEALFRVWDVVLCMHDGSTFLFQVALALLKLNEKSLRECDTPAGVYHYINHQMTNHAISIDGLIQASDALGKVIKRKDVEERRERAVAQEQELMRQREELRQERARKRAMRDSEPESVGELSAISTGTGTGDDYESVNRDRAPSLSASLDAELSLHTSPMRTPLSSASRRSEEEEDAEALNKSLEELSARTPMPVDEEMLWRG